MGLRDRVIEGMGGVTDERLNEVVKRNEEVIAELTASFNQRVNEAYEAGFFDGNDDPAQGDFQAGGLGYKRLADSYIRDGRIDYKKALNTAWDLMNKSPIAKRVLTLKRDHIIGHNATPDCDDEDLLEIILDFWEDNEMKRRSSEFVMQLFGFGEQCYPAFVREADGKVRLGYIDPGMIHTIVKHPDNALEDWAVIIDKYDGDNYTNEKLCYRIIRKAEDLVENDEVVAVENEGRLVTWEQTELESWEYKMLASYDKTSYDGSCFYVKVNAVSNQSRGMSDLLQVGDWLDQADEVLFSLGDREQFADFFSFDVKMLGASKEQVRERSAELRKNPPEKGSVNVHSDAEEWQMHSPDLRQSGSVETFRAILGLILGGMGFPVYFYGFGDDANRATASVQADPTSKSLEHDQGVVRDLFIKMCWFVADQAEIAGEAIYTPKDGTRITLDLPEVSAKDLTRTTTAMQALVISLINAQDAGWITNQTSAIVFSKMLAELDVQYDAKEELAKAEKEKEEADRERMANSQQQLQLAMQGNQFGDNGYRQQDDVDTGQTPQERPATVN